MPNEIVDHLGKKYPSWTSLCKAYNLKHTTLKARLNRGWDLEKALTVPTNGTRTVYDFEGNSFGSTQMMCEHYNIPSNIYSARIKSGWALKDALTIPTSTKAKEVVDFEGNKFPSIKEMCHHYGIPRNTYLNRIKSGWTLKDALLTPLYGNRNMDDLTNLVKSHYNTKSKKFQNRNYIELKIYDGNFHVYVIADYNGKSFSSVTDMCKYHMVTMGKVLYDLKKGLGLKHALTPKVIKDHLGNVFPNKKAMYAYYGIRAQTAENRLHCGWTLEETLTIPPKKKHNTSQ